MRTTVVCKNPVARLEALDGDVDPSPTLPVNGEGADPSPTLPVNGEGVRARGRFSSPVDGGGRLGRADPSPTLPVNGEGVEVPPPLTGEVRS